MEKIPDGGYFLRFQGYFPTLTLRSTIRICIEVALFMLFAVGKVGAKWAGCCL